MTSAWKKRCPAGHSSWRSNSGNMHSPGRHRGNYWCESCGEYFDALEPAPKPETPAWKGEVTLK